MDKVIIIRFVNEIFFRILLPLETCNLLSSSLNGNSDQTRKELRIVEKNGKSGNGRDFEKEKKTVLQIFFRRFVFFLDFFSPN